MSVVFTEGRALPKELRGDFGRYGDAGSDIAAGLKAVSPWDFLTGIFVDKPKAEAAAQVALAQTNAQNLAANDQLLAARQKTLRTAALAGAGVLGLLVLVIAMKPHRAPAVAGYRKSRRSKRSRR